MRSKFLLKRGEATLGLWRVGLMVYVGGPRKFLMDAQEVLDCFGPGGEAGAKFFTRCRGSIKGVEDATWERGIVKLREGGWSAEPVKRLRRLTY